MRKLIAIGLFLVLALPAVAYVRATLQAGRAAKGAEQAWAADFGPFDEAIRKHPSQAANETATRLEPAVQPLGLDLAPLDPRQGNRAADAPAWAAAVNAYVVAQLATPGAEVEAPPEEVARFLEEHRGDLDAIESLLVAGPPPVWALDLAAPKNGRLPTGLALLALQRALTARSLAAVHAGHADAAARGLEASWSLNASLRGRGETNALLISLAAARLQVGALRKVVSADAAVWKTRLASLDYRRDLAESIFLSRGRAREGRARSRREGGGLRALVMGPWRRLSAAKESNAVRGEVVRLRDAPPSDQLPEPDPVAGAAIPNLRNAFLRAYRLVVDAELTARVLDARAARAASKGRWPATLPGVETSAYPGASWSYTVAADGTATIGFSKELKSPYTEKDLPLTFASR